MKKTSVKVPIEHKKKNSWLQSSITFTDLFDSKRKSKDFNKTEKQVIWPKFEIKDFHRKDDE